MVVNLALKQNHLSYKLGESAFKMVWIIKLANLHTYIRP